MSRDDPQSSSGSSAITNAADADRGTAEIAGTPQGATAVDPAPAIAASQAPECNRSPAEHRGQPQAREYGGRDGPEPTRFGDWEKGGRCIDF